MNCAKYYICMYIVTSGAKVVCYDIVAYVAASGFDEDNALEVVLRTVIGRWRRPRCCSPHPSSFLRVTRIFFSNFANFFQISTQNIIF